METSIYGSELEAAQLYTEIRHKLRMLGADIKNPTIMYGNNQNMVISTISSKNALEPHEVKEEIAAEVITFRFIRS